MLREWVMNMNKITMSMTMKSKRTDCSEFKQIGQKVLIMCYISTIM